MQNASNFGPDRFSQLYGCTTYPFFGELDGNLSRLLDHGFVADSACVWDQRLTGHEFAIVARTYCSDVEIDNPPAGLKVVRLNPDVMGKEDQGTAIAVVIVEKSDASESVLAGCMEMPANKLIHLISKEMVDSGYGMRLQIGENLYSPEIKLARS